MKYVVVSIYNSELDACSLNDGHNQTGVCTCSTGDGFPAVFVESGTFDDKQTALDYADRLFEKLFIEFQNNGTYGDWNLQKNCNKNCLEVNHPINPNTDELIESLWVLSIQVLEIQD